MQHIVLLHIYNLQTQGGACVTSASLNKMCYCSGRYLKMLTIYHKGWITFNVVHRIFAGNWMKSFPHTDFATGSSSMLKLKVTCFENHFYMCCAS